MKTIIAIQATANNGKSTICNEFNAKLLQKFRDYDILETSSQRFVYKLNKIKKVIAIESQGDPGTGLGNRLNDIVSNHKPDVIVCTCRTSGETVDAVNNLTQYDKIFTSPYRYYDQNKGTQATRTNLNELNAEHLLNLLIKFGRL